MADKCRKCDKYAYRSRKAAKVHRKRMGDHQRAYECPGGEGWHLGHLPAAVLRGDAEMVTYLPDARRAFTYTSPN